MSNVAKATSARMSGDGNVTFDEAAISSLRTEFGRSVMNSKVVLSEEEFSDPKSEV